jgi:peptidyl-prolyl cis-trans isomerase C
MKAVERPLELEAIGIRQTIARQRTEDRIKGVLAEARKANVRDLNLELVDDVTVSAQGDLAPAKRPGVLPTRRTPAGPPVPAHDHR